MRTRFIACLALLALAACSRQTVPLKTETDHRSSERITDTVTRIVPDSAMIRALLECDSLGQVRIRELYTENGRLIRLNAQLRDNLLQFQARGESQERVREIVRTDTVYQSVEVPVFVREPVVEYRLRWWQRWLAWIGAFYLVRTGIKAILGWKNISLKNLFKLF